MPKQALAAFVCFALAAAGARSAFASLNDTETRLNTFSVAQPQAFAVYCATDESLDFYKRSEIPNTGATFEGKTATRIFANVETTSASAVPWKSIAANVRTIAIVDEIRPTSTAQWFAGFNACEGLDFSHLDTTHTNSMTAMISECLRVSNIVLGSKFSCTGSGSVSDFAFPQGEGIPYATGAWIAESNKTAYAATNIPSNKADTYRLQYGIEGSIALTGEAAVGETIIAALSDTSEKALTRMTWYRIDPQGIRTEINASLVRVIEEDSRGNHLKTAYTAQPEDAGCTLLCTAFDASGVYVGTIESAPTKTMAKPLEAYAVFSNQDGSLEFFNDRNKPAPGETSRTGKVVTEVYEGFVNKSLRRASSTLEDYARQQHQKRFIH